MKIKITELKGMCISILQNKGLNEQDAGSVFNEYLDAELMGKGSHGFHSFAAFCTKLEKSEGPAIVLKEEDNFFYIDGKKNLGQVVCNEYVPKLIEKAKKKNIAMMGIYNMHSFLMPGTYARMVAENNLIAMIFNYGSWPRIVPTGAIDPKLGTNPLAIGIPGKEYPIVLDMATSEISMMKVRVAKKLGKQIPEGVAMDKDGNMTTDPGEALDGGVLPFGGYKGYGLALAIEILTKTLFSVDIHDKTKVNRGFFFVLINPEAFIPIEKFKDGVDELINDIKGSRKAYGVEEIFIPGEQSEKTKKSNLQKDYLDLEEQTINEINEMIKSD